MNFLTHFQKRLLVAMVYFPLLLFSCFDTQLFAAAMVVIAGFGWHEYLLFRRVPSTPAEWTKHLSWVALGASPALFQLVGVSMVAGIGLLAVCLQYQIIRNLTESYQWEKSLIPAKDFLFGAFYISATTTMLLWCQERGHAQALLFLFVVVGAADTAAYLGGRFFGKTPFYQEISPKKTQEGFWWGLGVAIFVGIVFNLFLRWNSWEVPGILPSAILSWLVAMASVYGDLFESALKRHFGVKDSGRLFLTHGGALDRFDGVLFGVVPLFFYIALFDGFK